MVPWVKLLQATSFCVLSFAGVSHALGFAEDNNDPIGRIASDLELRQGKGVEGEACPLCVTPLGSMRMRACLQIVMASKGSSSRALEQP